MDDLGKMVLDISKANDPAVLRHDQKRQTYSRFALPDRMLKPIAQAAAVHSCSSCPNDLYCAVQNEHSI